MSSLAGLWRSLWLFHRLLAGILVLEYALTFAIVLTATGVLSARVAAITQTSGIDENGLYVLQGRGIQQPIHLFELMNAKVRFEALAGRGNVTLGSSVPFYGENSLDMPISVPGEQTHDEQQHVNIYEGDARFATVLGSTILNGRAFQPEEEVHHFGDETHLVILSASLARRLFHGLEPVGRQVEIGGHLHTVIGIVNPLAAPQDLGGELSMYTALLPKVSSSIHLVVIRYGGPKADLSSVLAALRKQDAGKLSWSLWPYSDVHSAYFSSDRMAVVALAAVVGVVIVTALCGILGLTNYWISRRRPQIAIRRALGAKRRDVFGHFLMESGFLVALGLVVGSVLNLLFGGYLGIVYFQGGIRAWLISITLALLMAFIVICASLRHLLRMNPAELMRLS